MKKILFALIASATALSGASAYAADDAGTGYLGAGLLGSRYSFNGPTATSGDDRTGTKAAGKIFGGYNIDKTFAVEGGYTDFGSQTYNYTVGTAANRLESDAHSFYLAGKASAPINEQFSVFGKLGVSRNHNSIGSSGTAASVYGSSGNKTALYASVGAEYALNKNVSLSLEYENYGKNENSLGRKNGAITGGLRYNF